MAGSLVGGLPSVASGMDLNRFAGNGVRTGTRAKRREQRSIIVGSNVARSYGLRDDIIARQLSPIANSVPAISASGHGICNQRHA